MDYPSSLYYQLRNILSCLLALVGLGGGLFLIIRKHTVPGILALVGFLMFAGQSLLGLFANADWFPWSPGASWALLCLNTGMESTGMVALIVALLYFVLGKKKDAVPPDPSAGVIPPL